MRAFLSDKKRRLIQILSAIITNPFIGNLFTGKIYKGAGKNLCVPGLNCYSCPAAAGSCPIGAWQTVAGHSRFHFSYYVTGFLILVGTLLGRVVCGFLCVFGFLQDLLYLIPLPKFQVPKALDQKLRYLKYAVLLFLVLLLPAVLTDEFGLGKPFFCEYLCPAGTLEGGIPLMLTTPSLRAMAGTLFYWKLGITLLLLISSMVIYRPFCRYLCPLGAFYALFNRISFIHLELDKTLCTQCGRCNKTCPMEVTVTKNPNGAECIRCGRCIKTCPTSAIKWGQTPFRP